MSAAQEPIGTLLRPVFEAKAGLAWAVAAVWVLAVSLIFQIGWIPAACLFAVTAGMAVYRGTAAKELIERQLSLIGRPVDFLKASDVHAAIPEMGNKLWLGWGWYWQPSHTALAYEINKRDLTDIYPKGWMLRVMGVERNPANERGLQWVHGLEKDEKDMFVELDTLKGHCAVIATTGAIKTRLAGMIIPQLVARGDVVIIVDPKGDKDLKKIAQDAAEATGVPGKFLYLHPSFAKSSIRLDMLKNWERSSQVASRISLVLSSQEDSTFKEFCWMAVHRLTNGVKYLGRRVTIMELKQAMESRSAVERLAYDVLKKFFTEEARSLLDRVEQELGKEHARKGPPKRSGAVETSIPELTAMISVFQSDVPETKALADGTGLPHKPEDVRGLVTILEANKEWFGKMIVSITPMLTKLTADDLGPLLSPDYTDLSDTRPIMDMHRVVQGGHVLNIGTDALADPDVGKALVSLAMAELASVAAEIYNHGMPGDDGAAPRRIHVFIDEWGDAMCEPLVQQANKGRGAGVNIWALGQTFSDLVHAFGGRRDSALRFMGNMNNLIVGAIQDPETIKLVSEKFSETTITVVSESKGVGSKTEDTGMEFSANHGRSSSDKEVALIPPFVFSQLPDLQYIALVNRSQKIKGRIPVVLPG